MRGVHNGAVAGRGFLHIWRWRERRRKRASHSQRSAQTAQVSQPRYLLIPRKMSVWLQLGSPAFVASMADPAITYLSG